jgi:tripartite-type tricarboxylate transporter receptor subunit TctC
LVRLVLPIVLVNLLTGPATAQDWPDRPVRIVVPFAAGGTADAVPRLVADFLSRKWGQPVIIDNRTGRAAISAPRRSITPAGATP